MPCYSPPDPPVPTGEMLCAILRAAARLGVTSDQLAEKADWEEAGVARKYFEQWWKNHQQRDLERRKSKREAAEHAAARKQFLAGLTPEQRRLLGVDE